MGWRPAARTTWPAMVSVPPIGTIAKVMKAGMTTRNGASLKTVRSASAGTRSSLKISLMPSATVCRSPKGPQRCGPMRLCMSEMALRSNQIIKMTALSKHREGHHQAHDENDPDREIQSVRVERVDRRPGHRASNAISAVSAWATSQDRTTSWPSASSVPKATSATPRPTASSSVTDRCASPTWSADEHLTAVGHTEAV